jgi:hypothetical protein
MISKKMIKFDEIELFLEQISKSNEAVANPGTNVIEIDSKSDFQLG